jgi:hypothetical protein
VSSGAVWPRWMQAIAVVVVVATPVTQWTSPRVDGLGWGLPRPLEQPHADESYYGGPPLERRPLAPAVTSAGYLLGR